MQSSNPYSQIERLKRQRDQLRQDLRRLEQLSPESEVTFSSGPAATFATFASLPRSRQMQQRSSPLRDAGLWGDSHPGFGSIGPSSRDDIRPVEELPYPAREPSFRNYNVPTESRSGGRQTASSAYFGRSRIDSTSKSRSPSPNRRRPFNVPSAVPDVDSPPRSHSHRSHFIRSNGIQNNSNSSMYDGMYDENHAQFSDEYEPDDIGNSILVMDALSHRRSPTSDYELARVRLHKMGFKAPVLEDTESFESPVQPQQPRSYPAEPLPREGARRQASPASQRRPIRRVSPGRQQALDSVGLQEPIVGAAPYSSTSVLADNAVSRREVEAIECLRRERVLLAVEIENLARKEEFLRLQQVSVAQAYRYESDLGGLRGSIWSQRSGDYGETSSREAHETLQREMSSFDAREQTLMQRVVDDWSISRRQSEERSRSPVLQQVQEEEYASPDFREQLARASWEHDRELIRRAEERRARHEVILQRLHYYEPPMSSSARSGPSSGDAYQFSRTDERRGQQRPADAATASNGSQPPPPPPQQQQQQQEEQKQQPASAPSASSAAEPAAAAAPVQAVDPSKPSPTAENNQNSVAAGSSSTATSAAAPPPAGEAAASGPEVASAGTGEQDDIAAAAVPADAAAASVEVDAGTVQQQVAAEEHVLVASEPATALDETASASSEPKQADIEQTKPVSGEQPAPQTIEPVDTPQEQAAAAAAAAGATGAVEPAEDDASTAASPSVAPSPSVRSAADEPLVVRLRENGVELFVFEAAKPVRRWFSVDADRRILYVFKESPVKAYKKKKPLPKPLYSRAVGASGNCNVSVWPGINSENLLVAFDRKTGRLKKAVNDAKQDCTPWAASVVMEDPTRAGSDPQVIDIAAFSQADLDDIVHALAIAQDRHVRDVLRSPSA